MRPLQRGALARLLCQTFVLVWLLPHMVYAQSAINLGVNEGDIASTLPRRNIAIEVRQLSRQALDMAVVSTAAQAQLRTASSAASATLQATALSQQKGDTGHYQALVLNGQRVFIALHSSLPLRLVSSQLVNGVLAVAGGTVLLEAGSGFDATPRWQGGPMVELSLLAAQRMSSARAQTASTSTWLVLPLDHWVTVAHADRRTDADQANLAASARWSHAGDWLVQVRVSLR